MNNRAQILITAVDQTRQAFDSIKRNLGGLGDHARTLNGLLANLGVAVSAAGFAEMLKGSIEAADQLDELSQKAGISVEALSTLKLAAEHENVGADAFATALKRLAGSLFEASTGAQENQRLFQALGVEYQTAQGTLRSTDQILLQLADRFAAMPDGPEKAAIAVKLFGKAGTDLIPFLNRGAQGIEELRGQFADLGGQISGDTASQAAEFNDNLNLLHQALQGVANRIAASLLPALADFARGLVESAKEGGSLRSILDGVVYVLKILALGAAVTANGFLALGESMGAGIAAGVEALKGNAAQAKGILDELQAGLAQRRDRVIAFHDSLFNPQPSPPGQPPAIRPDVEAIAPKLRKLSSGGSANNMATARLALWKAQMDAEFSVLKAGLDRSQAALDRSLDDRLVSIRDYYTEKTALEQREIDAEIARTSAQMAEQQRLAQGGQGESERLRAKAEVAKLEAELRVLNSKRTETEISNAHKATQAERELREELARAREELLDLTGKTSTADRRAAIERQYQPLIDKLRTEGDAQGARTVGRLVDVKAASGDLAAYERQFNEALTRMRTAEESVNLQRQSGLLTELQARRQILDLHQATGMELEGLLPKLRQAAAAIGPEAVARVQQWKNEIAQTKIVTDDVAVAIDGAVKDGFVSMFETIGNGSKSAKDAFLDFARSVLAAINRIAAQKLAEALFGGLGGGSSGAGGFSLGSLITSLFKGFATGGYVTGPGTTTSDSIPARLSSGEYVVNAAAVRRVGIAFLDAVNGLSQGPRVSGGRLAFAAGGLVPEKLPTPSQGQGVRIVNVVDPDLVHDYLSSSAGEKVILNQIQRNAGSIKQLLK